MGLIIRTMIRLNLRGVNTARRIIGMVRPTDEIIANTRYGSRFKLRPDDYIDRTVLREGYYESEVLDAMVEGTPRGGVVWDVGGNFGLHAITVKILRPDLSVYCFEPSPASATRILHHAAMNKVDISVFAIGLGEAPALARLHVMGTGNPGMTTFVPWDKAKYSESVIAQIETGDRIVEAGMAPLPDVIKLDIEGGEAAAIDGMRSILGKGRTRLIFEGSDQLIPNVSAVGYRDIHKLTRSENTEHPLSNFVALPWVIKWRHCGLYATGRT